MRLNDSAEGRWYTPDPLGGDITNPQSLNRYAYALNNPTTLTDPLGLFTPGPGNPPPFLPITIGPCTYEAIEDAACYGGSSPAPPGYVPFPPPGGGSTGPPPPPKPARPANTPAAPNTGCKTGFNFGVTGGADGGLGVGIPRLQAAALGGGSAGLTFGGGTPIGAYASASGGAAAGPWGTPNQGNNLTAVGGGAAAGVGITFGNATSAGQMRGNALTFGVGIDAGVGGGVQVTFGTDATGHTIWQVNITGGVGYKFYGYSLMTHTVAAST
ncbi:MAG: RHS repeat-associated core domain-containing protein, partial [Terriglobia bacterium]